MNTPRCAVCDDWMFRLPHVCKPVFDVWLPEDGETQDDAREVHADDAEQAAEIVAERYDVDDHPLLNGHKLEVHVRDKAGVVTVFMVTAEAEVRYIAHELTNE